jgi:hypothetical protein
MSILGLVSKVVVEYKADTSDIKAKLKELSGEERKLHEQRLRDAEAENKRLDRQVKNLGVLAAGIAASAVAVAAAKRGMEAYAKTSAEAAAEVDKLKNNVGRAFNTIEVAIGRVVVALAPLIEGLAKVAQFSASGLGDLAMLATGDTDGLYRKHGLAKDRQTGERYLSDAREMYIRNAGGGDNPFIAARAAAEFDRQQKLNAQRDALEHESNARVARSVMDAAGVFRDGINTVGGFIHGRLNDPWASKPAKMGRRGARRDLPFISTSEYTDPLVAQLEAEIEADRAAQSAADTSSMIRGFVPTGGIPAGGGVDAAMTKFYGAGGEMSRRSAEAYGAFQGEKAQSFLEKTFGPVGEFDVYANAFTALSGAVGSAMTAWIDGSMSAGQAFKAFIAEAVKGIAVQMAMEALKHGAYAIGNLAIGNVAGASMHAKSAALFAAGAAAAAGAAKGLHGSGSGGAGYSPGAPSYSGPNRGGAQQGSAVTIVYGDSFADDSPRQRQLKAKKMVNTAIGTSAVEYR